VFFHDLLVDNYAAGNVFSNGQGLDVALDHHGGCPYGNLWTNINVVRAAVAPAYIGKGWRGDGAASVV
jgi:hypothetical protein